MNPSANRTTPRREFNSTEGTVLRPAAARRQVQSCNSRPGFQQPQSLEGGRGGSLQESGHWNFSHNFHLQML